MCVKQCHKPPMTGNGLYHLFTVIWEMVYSCFTHSISSYDDSPSHKMAVLASPKIYFHHGFQTSQLRRHGQANSPAEAQSLDQFVVRVDGKVIELYRYMDRRRVRIPKKWHMNPLQVAKHTYIII